MVRQPTGLDQVPFHSHMLCEIAALSYLVHDFRDGIPLGTTFLKPKDWPKKKGKAPL